MLEGVEFRGYGPGGTVPVKLGREKKLEEIWAGILTFKEFEGNVVAMR